MIVNATGVVVGEVVAIICISLRIVVSAYFSFYAGKNQQVHQITLVAGMITSFAVLVANIDQEYYIFLLVATALLVLLAQTKLKIQREWEEVNDEENHDELALLRKRLFKDTAYVRAFR